MTPRDRWRNCYTLHYVSLHFHQITPIWFLSSARTSSTSDAILLKISLIANQKQTKARATGDLGKYGVTYGSCPIWDDISIYTNTNTLLANGSIKRLLLPPLAFSFQEIKAIARCIIIDRISLRFDWTQDLGRTLRIHADPIRKVMFYTNITPNIDISSKKGWSLWGQLFSKTEQTLSLPAPVSWEISVIYMI